MRKCQQAGILVRMITGDNLLTAKSIAREIGILTDGNAVEGPDFRQMTPEQQREVLKTLQVDLSWMMKALVTSVSSVFSAKSSARYLEKGKN